MFLIFHWDKIFFIPRQHLISSLHFYNTNPFLVVFFQLKLSLPTNRHEGNFIWLLRRHNLRHYKTTVYQTLKDTARRTKEVNTSNYKLPWHPSKSCCHMIQVQQLIYEPLPPRRSGEGWGGDSVFVVLVGCACLLYLAVLVCLLTRVYTDYFRCFLLKLLPIWFPVTKLQAKSKPTGSWGSQDSWILVCKMTTWWWPNIVTDTWCRKNAGFWLIMTRCFHYSIFIFDINLSISAPSYLKMYVYIWRLVCWLSLGIYFLSGI